VRDPRKCIRIFFVRCLLKEAYSKSCGSGGTGETPQTRSVEEAHRPPRCSLSILERKSTDNIDRRKQQVWRYILTVTVFEIKLYDVHLIINS
jgi:hypothetical protein